MTTPGDLLLNSSNLGFNLTLQRLRDFFLFTKKHVIVIFWKQLSRLHDKKRQEKVEILLPNQRLLFTKYSRKDCLNYMCKYLHVRSFHWKKRWDIVSGFVDYDQFEDDILEKTCFNVFPLQSNEYKTRWVNGFFMQIETCGCCSHITVVVNTSYHAIRDECVCFVLRKGRDWIVIWFQGIQGYVGFHRMEDSRQGWSSSKTSQAKMAT